MGLLLQTLLVLMPNNLLELAVNKMMEQFRCNIVRKNLTVLLLMMLYNYREELTSVDVLKILKLVFVVLRRKRR